MQLAKVSADKFLIRLEQGELLQESLKSFCQKKGVKSGSLSGIGSIEDPILAHYRVDTKKYSEKKLTGIFEVAVLTGNIALYEGEVLIQYFPFLNRLIGP